MNPKLRPHAIAVLAQLGESLGNGRCLYLRLRCLGGKRTSASVSTFAATGLGIESGALLIVHAAVIVFDPEDA
jgi:hypothetical protein